MTVLFATHPAYLEHLTGPGHPERPARLQAVVAGAKAAGIAEALTPLEPVAASRQDLERVHPAWYLDRIDAVSEAGGGWIDADTRVERDVRDGGAPRRGRRSDGGGRAARRPRLGGVLRRAAAGHHATPTDAMGFCLVSNIAVVAAALADAGERVWILDYDAHHGNGTQAAFVEDPRVLFVSFHQWPLYPGTGRATEIGTGAGIGTTMNVPLPPGATGDVYLAAFDEIVAPVVERFAPTWLLISAGFDAHRDDPLTELGLTAGDYPLLTARALQFVPAGRCVAMLEGGYDLDALSSCATAVLGTLAGVDVADGEAPSSGGPGAAAVDAVRQVWAAR